MKKSEVTPGPATSLTSVSMATEGAWSQPHHVLATQESPTLGCNNNNNNNMVCGG